MKTLIFATTVAFSLCTLSAVLFFGAMHHVITFLFCSSTALYLYKDKDGGASPKFVLLRLYARALLLFPTTVNRHTSKTYHYENH